MTLRCRETASRMPWRQEVMTESFKHIRSDDHQITEVMWPAQCWTVDLLYVNVHKHKWTCCVHLCLSLQVDLTPDPDWPGDCCPLQAAKHGLIQQQVSTVLLYLLLNEIVILTHTLLLHQFCCFNFIFIQKLLRFLINIHIFEVLLLHLKSTASLILSNRRFCFDCAVWIIALCYRLLLLCLLIDHRLK